MVQISYPGVYIEEVSFRAKPIDGVSTSTAGLIGATHHEAAHTPEWTDFNGADPGITLMQVQAWIAESQVYRSRFAAHAQAVGPGVVGGLDVTDGASGGSGGSASVQVGAGTAIGREGQPIDATGPGRPDERRAHVLRRRFDE